MQRLNNTKLDEINNSIMQIDKVMQNKDLMITMAETQIDKIPDKEKMKEVKNKLSELKSYYTNIKMNLHELESKTSLLKSKDRIEEKLNDEELNLLTQDVNNILQNVNSEKGLNDLVKELMPQLPSAPEQKEQALWLGEDLRVNTNAAKPKPLPQIPKSVKPTPPPKISMQHPQSQMQSEIAITSSIYYKLSTQAKLACLEKTLQTSDDANYQCVKNYIDLKKIMENKDSRASQVTEALLILNKSIKDNTAISDIDKNEMMKRTSDLYLNITKVDSSLNQNTDVLDKLIIKNTSQNCVREFNRNIESFHRIEDLISSFEKGAKYTFRKPSDVMPLLNERCSEAKKALLQSGDIKKVLGILNGEEDKTNKNLSEKRVSGFKLLTLFSGSKTKNEIKFEEMKKNLIEINDSLEKRNTTNRFKR